MSFLGTSANVHKATLSFVIYVCPFVHVEKLGFIKFYIKASFQNVSRKFKSHYNLTIITVLYRNTDVHL
jgi:hypothetical protein